MYPLPTASQELFDVPTPIEINGIGGIPLLVIVERWRFALGPLHVQGDTPRATQAAPISLNPALLCVQEVKPHKPVMPTAPLQPVEQAFGEPVHALTLCPSAACAVAAVTSHATNQS